jgi:predicted metal-dependent hydrolase
MEQNISDDVIVKNLAVEIAELLFKKGNKYLSKKKPENYNEEESLDTYNFIIKSISEKLEDRLYGSENLQYSLSKKQMRDAYYDLSNLDKLVTVYDTKLII